MTSWRRMPLPLVESAFAGTLAVSRERDGVRPVRLTSEGLRRAPEALALMAQFTSGVRLRIVTDADRIRLTAAFTRFQMAHLHEPGSRAEVLAEVDGAVVARAVADPTGVVIERKDGPWARTPEVISTLELALGDTDAPRAVVLWLPTDAAVRVIALEATGDVVPAAPDARPRWVHHGSSISHGGDAADALATWPVQAARALDVDVVNLGFGGNAMIDPPTARAIARTPADVITLKFGINIVTGDAMRRRVFVPALHGFLDTVRDAHPDVPVVVMSAIVCPAFEDVPGPRRIDEHGRLAGTPRPGDIGALTLRDTRDAIAEVLASRSDDTLLTMVDGRELLGPADAGLLYDGVHPEPAGYDLIARRFAAAASDSVHPLGVAFGVAKSRHTD